jgi:uncharacterized protein YdaU (DUF1376 family)
MTKAPAFQLYASDFDMDTASWTCPQVGVYIRLLMYSWVNGGIPNSISEMARITRMDRRTLAKMWDQTVGKKWTLNAANMYVNNRLELEREKQANYKETQSKKGKAGNQIKWKDHIAGAIPVRSPEHRSSSSSSSSKRNNKFIIPELSEIAAYCIERKTGINPQTFFDHYSSNGWMVGKNKMKDWKAAIRTWEARGGNQNAGIRTNRSDPRDKTLQSREDAEVAAITAKWEASKKAASNNPGGATGNDDAPNFSGE